MPVIPIYRMLEKLLLFLDHHRDRRAKALVRNGATSWLMERRLLTPNGLSIARIAIALGIFIYLAARLGAGAGLELDTQASFVIALCFGLAALTDMFDGPLARNYAHLLTRKTRRLGVNLDRHADKVLTLPLLAIYLPFVDSPTRWLLGLAIAGDVLATLLAILAASLGNPIPANAFGKAKMASLCLGIYSLMLSYPRGVLVFQLIMAVSLTLGVVSLITNGAIFIKHYRATRAEIESAVTFTKAE